MRSLSKSGEAHKGRRGDPEHAAANNRTITINPRQLINLTPTRFEPMSIDEFARMLTQVVFRE